MDIWCSILGLTKPSIRKIIRRFQSKVLPTITNAPWHIFNPTLHNDLQIPFDTNEIQRLATLYNRTPFNIKRRLKRQWRSDL